MRRLTIFLLTMAFSGPIWSDPRQEWAQILQGQPAEVRAFLKRFPQAVHWQDEEGETALLEAAEDGRVDIVRLLLESGADVAHCDEDGETALMEAAAEGHFECVALLLKSGSPVGLRDKKERSALDQAKDERVRQLLRARGAR